MRKFLFGNWMIYERTEHDVYMIDESNKGTYYLYSRVIDNWHTSSYHSTPSTAYWSSSLLPWTILLTEHFVMSTNLASSSRSLMTEVRMTLEGICLPCRARHDTEHSHSELTFDTRPHPFPISIKRNGVTHHSILWGVILKFSASQKVQSSMIQL